MSNHASLLAHSILCPAPPKTLLTSPRSVGRLGEKLSPVVYSPRKKGDNNTKVHATFFPLYYTSVAATWPEEGRHRRLVTVDEAIELVGREELKGVLRQGEELKGLACGMLASNTGTSVLNISVADSASVSNATNTSPFATRFAWRSQGEDFGGGGRRRARRARGRGSGVGFHPQVINYVF